MTINRIVCPVNSRYSVATFADGFAGHDMVSVDQFSDSAQVEKLFAVAAEMEGVVARKKSANILAEVTIAQLFYEASTRTDSSFQAAAFWLGCDRVYAAAGMGQFSSATKGETLRDTVRVIEQTTACDVMVLRHPEDDSAYEAAHYAQVPVINAGAGKLEHPTQALLDLYTIRRRLRKRSGLRVGMMGDMKYGRTAKSLAKLLTVVDPSTKFHFIAPEILAMPSEETKTLRSRGAVVEEREDLLPVLGQLDVLYVTRLQKERFVTTEEQKQYARLKDVYTVTPEVMQQAQKDMLLMHPLPRVGEIADAVDSDPRSVYFEQMRMGLYIRMALLGLLTGKIT